MTHKLLARQIARSTTSDGIDFSALLELVNAAYEDHDQDRDRTDRASRLMSDETEHLNRKLEATVGRLAAQNARFEAALENMPHGMCMFDRHNRLVVANGRFRDLLGLPPRLVETGVGLRTIVAYLVRAGSLDRAETRRVWYEVASSFAAGVSGLSCVFSSGRTIEASVRHAGDAGWIAVCEDVTERRHAQERIRHMARHDALTDLPNRTQFHEQLTWELTRIGQHGQIAIMCLDLDRFKTVNDTLGHPVGDQLLLSVADRLTGCVQLGDTVARLGGDEFAIIQVGVDQPEGATLLSRRIIDVLGAPYLIDGHQITVGVTIGIATAPVDGQNSNTLLKNADLALYHAKDARRGTASFFEPGMDDKMQQRRALEFDLRRALDQGEFTLYYQPLINLASNDISGFEALIRWQHPERGMVPPDEFIPVAEEIGLIEPIGDWVLKKACADAMQWPKPVKVAVNLSPNQFQFSNLAEAVVTALSQSGLEPSRLELEITERVMLQDTDHTVAVLRQLRDLGVRISMDDFGTGYSSLSYLRRFPFDKIKIDQSFIFDLDKGKDALAIIRAVAGLSASLGMVTTAEGVETKAQLDRLRLEGCHEVQGYFFSKPRPAHEVAGLLATFRAGCPDASMPTPRIAKVMGHQRQAAWSRSASERLLVSEP